VRDKAALKSGLRRIFFSHVETLNCVADGWGVGKRSKTQVALIWLKPSLFRRVMWSRYFASVVIKHWRLTRYLFNKARRPSWVAYVWTQTASMSESPLILVNGLSSFEGLSISLRRA